MHVREAGALAAAVAALHSGSQSQPHPAGARVPARGDDGATTIRNSDRPPEPQTGLNTGLDALERSRALEGFVGDSTALRRVLQRVAQVASTAATVLIHGETGTGKELVARAVHRLSPRRDRRFVTMNCGAISTALAESELFGHERGAFTGALQQRIGRFELADGGTIFLDEVGELPPETQVKLLRVLQEREVERLGGAQSRRIDVRVVAATNRDLQAEVKAGRFRADLYYRLNVFPLEMPPLRERAVDIPLLVSHQLRRLAKRLGKTLSGVSPETLDRLVRHPWPGNVRELENVLERAAIVAEGPVIHIDELPGAVPVGVSERAGSWTLEAVERSHIRSVLEQTGWSLSGSSGAATLLGLNPSTLRSRMQKLGIRRPVPGRGLPTA